MLKHTYMHHHSWLQSYALIPDPLHLLQEEHGRRPRSGDHLNLKVAQVEIVERHMHQVCAVQVCSCHFSQLSIPMSQTHCADLMKSIDAACAQVQACVARIFKWCSAAPLPTLSPGMPYMGINT